jgi:hypothetical protein
MKQTKRASLIESLLNVAIGYGVALLSQVIVFPWFDIHVSISANIALGGVFTIISIVRSFAVRRLFEHLRVKGILP